MLTSIRTSIQRRMPSSSQFLNIPGKQCCSSSYQQQQHQHQHLGTLATINPKASHNPKNKSSKHRKQGGASSYKFVDRARIKVTAGNGGKGCLSFESKFGSPYKKRPDGGHGGHGGNIVIVADENEQSLNMQSHHIKGEDGKNGSSKQCHGRKGEDKIIRVPCGVVVKRVLEYHEYWDKDELTVKTISVDDEEESDFLKGDKNEPKYRFDDKVFDNHNTLDSDDIDANKPNDYEEIVNSGVKSDDDGMYHWETENIADNDDDELVSSSENIYNGDREQVSIGDLDKPGSYVVVATGGRGGVGNSAYAKRQHVADLVARASEKAVGVPGQLLHLELELKLIADVGLVGFPNAGKSSLLAAMSKAQPEIAPYPFTTLHPLVGTLEYRDGFRAVVADVPGLISGAAEGRGRGFDFLRHLERTKALLYIVDAAGVDGRDPLNDLSILVDEIRAYGDSDMLERPALVVANKMDLITDPDLQDEILVAISNTALDCGIQFDGEVHGISAGVTGEGLGDLSSSIRSLVETGEELREEINAAASYDFTF